MKSPAGSSRRWGLETATPADLSEIEISPSGQGLYFPAIDADPYLPALLKGFLRSNAWRAARMGQMGGCATTQAKQGALQETENKAR